MIPIQVLHSSCQESLSPSLPPGAPPDILPLLCSWPLVLEKEGGAMIPIQVIHELDWTAMDPIFLFRKGVRYSEVLKYNYNCARFCPPFPSL